MTEPSLTEVFALSLYYWYVKVVPCTWRNWVGSLLMQVMMQRANLSRPWKSSSGKEEERGRGEVAAGGFLTEVRNGVLDEIGSNPLVTHNGHNCVLPAFTHELLVVETVQEEKLEKRNM